MPLTGICLRFVLLLVITAALGVGLARAVGAARPGDVVAYSSARGGSSDIFLLDVASGVELRLTDTPTNEEWPRWSPDGRFLAYMADDTQSGGLNIFTLELATGAVRQLTHGAGVQAFPTWSPDGRQIAFSAGTDLNDTDIQILDLASGQITRLPRTAVHERVSSWSGDVLLFSANGGGLAVFRLYRVNSDGRAFTSLPFGGAVDLNPVWSPDGQWFAFQALRDQDYEIVVRSADGRALRQLTDNGADDFSPMWSPDGQRLVFIRLTPEAGYEVYILQADGSGARRLTFNSFRENTPAFMP
ncbi:MAG: PD40 domain-containing protein [Chloroflexi bacterium]|nr:PD40 domain-containing protein [Chloroflexota bacterium]